MSASNYYILNESIDSKVIGKTFPQVQTMYNGYNYKAPNSIWNLKYNQLPDFEPNCDSFLLHNSAKLTDILSVAVINFGILMNQKVKDILINLSLPSQNNFFPASVVKKNEKRSDYYLFYFTNNLSDIIDYSKTEFVILNSNIVETSFKVKNEEELKLKRKEISLIKQIRTKRYHFQNYTMPQFDIFQTTYTDSRTYISHRLKTALEEANITGIEIVPTDII